MRGAGSNPSPYRDRQEAFGRGLVLVALTGYGQDDDRRRTREAGFDHHLTKPANLTALANIIQHGDC